MVIIILCISTTMRLLSWRMNEHWAVQSIPVHNLTMYGFVSTSAVRGKDRSASILTQVRKCIIADEKKPTIIIRVLVLYILVYIIYIVRYCAV